MCTKCGKEIIDCHRWIKRLSIIIDSQPNTCADCQWMRDMRISVHIAQFPIKGVKTCNQMMRWKIIINCDRLIHSYFSIRILDCFGLFFFLQKVKKNGFGFVIIPSFRRLPFADRKKKNKCAKRDHCIAVYTSEQSTLTKSLAATLSAIVRCLPASRIRVVK